MNDWAYKLAKEFKKRDNQRVNYTFIGEVVEINPLVISSYNGEIMLRESNNILYISDSLIDREYEVEYKLLDGSTSEQQTTITDVDTGIKSNIEIGELKLNELKGTILIKQELKKGEKVILVPDSSGNKFFVVGRIKE